ncbi:MAG: mannose-6-phosphate isomerase, class I [Acidimicrobiales bacterium]|nr:mannose-6-phosphate isomerase, class I [Acidimicrobiales bacterium]
MPLLEGTLKHYDWGSKTSIAELRGILPSGEPEAELWFGSENNFPWLVKILAIQKPLSLQLHPNTEQAVRGFETEEARGIKQDNPKRLYPDEKAKSELVCALTPFKAFCGLRNIDSAIEAAEVFDLPKGLFSPLLTDGGKGWSQVISDLLSEEWNQEIDSLLKRCKGDMDENWVKVAEEIVKISKIHKTDSSIMILPFMNYHELNPGDAIHIEPGVAHIYLQGMAVEVMEPGDNVVRAGLTIKHKDKKEFLSLLNISAEIPQVQSAHGPDHEYTGPVENLTVRRIEDTKIEVNGSRSVDLILTTTGTSKVEHEEETQLKPGEAFLIQGEDLNYTIDTAGSAFLVRG